MELILRSEPWGHGVVEAAFKEVNESNVNVCENIYCTNERVKY